jgi:hypothetical protein
MQRKMQSEIISSFDTLRNKMQGNSAIFYSTGPKMSILQNFFIAHEGTK